ncbi:MAG: DUF1080 domain-containing protein [Gemmataceae bacterium]
MFRSLLGAVALLLVPFASAADPKPIEPFNGKDLTGWKVKDPKQSRWSACGVSLATPTATTFTLTTPTGKDLLVNDIAPKTHGSDIFTEEKFGDVTVELEFMIPKGSNSGIYLMGEYEVQILDSYGKEKVGPGDLGGLYQAAAPKTNASKKPGEWQKFLIEFQAPKFEGDKKVANAKFVKVTLNDVVIHENIEMKAQTPGGLTGKEAATGPLMFQGNHGSVAFRNIKITPKK